MAHATTRAIADAMRERFRTAKGVSVANASEWFLRLDNAMLASVFAIPAGQVSGLRTRLTRHVEARDNARTRVGE